MNTLTKISPTTNGTSISNFFSGFTLFAGHTPGQYRLSGLNQQSELASWQVNLCLFKLLNINPS
jgi:hypothetical protein